MTPTDEEMQQRFEALPEGVADAVDAIMLFFEIVQEHADTVTILGLQEGLMLAMEQGHDMAQIHLFMLTRAVNECKALVDSAR